jgi:hypothetical protein
LGGGFGGEGAFGRGRGRGHGTGLVPVFVAGAKHPLVILLVADCAQMAGLMESSGE